MKMAGTAIFGRNLMELRIINVYENHNFQALMLPVGNFQKKPSISLWKESDAADVDADKMSLFCLVDVVRLSFTKSPFLGYT